MIFWTCCGEYAKDEANAAATALGTISIDIPNTSQDAGSLATGEVQPQLPSEPQEKLSVLTQEPVAEAPSVSTPEPAAEEGPLATLIEEGGESEITLQAMSGVSLGCEFETTDDQFCMVSEVSVKGLVDRWNSVHPAREQQLKVYDRLLEVASQPGPSQKLKVLLESETKTKYQTKIRYQRPRVQELRIKSKDGALGTEFDEQFKGNGLPKLKLPYVHKAMSEAGLTAAHRSRIVAVNGEAQLAPSKIMEMMQAEEFKITVCSYK